MRGFKKFFILGLATLYLFGALNGCSSERLDLESDLNDDALDSINYVETAYNLGNKYNDFTFIGADFAYNETYYDVGINGIAKTTKGKMNYVNMKYKVDCDFVENIDNTTEENVIAALNEIINNNEIYSYTSLEVESIDELCDTARTFAHKELNGGSLEKSFVYSISDLLLDDDKKQITFNIGQNARYKSTEEENNICISQHSVTLYCTNQEYEELSNNYSLILKTFISNVKDGQTDKYDITQKYESYKKHFNDGTIFDKKELGKLK